MQRQHDVIASRPETADPVLRPILSGVADPFRPRGGPGDERVERLEGEVGNVILDLQRQQSRPGDAQVQAIVGLAARRLRRIVSRARLESDVPVPGRRDLGGVGFIAVDEPPEELAGRRGDIDLQEEMPHDRHAVAADDEALNVFQIQWPGPGR